MIIAMSRFIEYQKLHGNTMFSCTECIKQIIIYSALTNTLEKLTAISIYGNVFKTEYLMKSEEILSKASQLENCKAEVP